MRGPGGPWQPSFARGTPVAPSPDMLGRTLQILGALAVVSLVAGATAGFAVLKDRVRIVVQDGETAPGPDPGALLRDDVQVLARDVQGLQQAVAQNFDALATGLEAGAQNRHADVLALRRQVAGLQDHMQRLQQSLAEMEGLVALLQSGRAAPSTSTMAAAPTADPTAASNGAGEPGHGQAPPEAAVRSSPAETAPAKGFLSFTLPSSRFRFECLQDYKLLPELSRVGFDAKSTLHDFSGVTSELTGSFRADFDDPQGLCEGEVVVRAEALKTGVDGRDSNMYEHLDTEHHAEIRFAIERFEAAANGIDVAAGTAKGEVRGRMTIRGRTRAFAMPVTIEVDVRQRLVVTGQQELKLTDYDVPVPSQLGLISMADEVVVWVALRARAQVCEAGRER